jgi:sulfonate transport system substrate-binding protein
MKMKKRFVAMTMAALMAVTALTGCGSSAKETPETLTFTYVTAPLNVPSIIEKEKGIFAEAFADMGINVEYAELTSGADQTQALASGDVQVLYAVGATSVILSAANDADIKVLNMYSRSPEAFCLFAQDDSLTSPESLRGKTIAGPAGTILHELLVSYLATADMTIEDVNYVNMSIPEAKAGLDGGSVDVAMLAGAAAYTAKLQGHSLVADGTGLVDAIIAVAVTEEFYNAHPEIIEKLKSAQDEIASFIAENEEEALQITADTLDLELDAVKEMFAPYDFSTELKETDRIGFQRTADFMYANGMIEKELDVNTLFFE